MCNTFLGGHYKSAVYTFNLRIKKTLKRSILSPALPIKIKCWKSFCLSERFVSATCLDLLFGCTGAVQSRILTGLFLYRYPLLFRITIQERSYNDARLKDVSRCYVGWVSVCISSRPPENRRLCVILLFRAGHRAFLSPRIGHWDTNNQYGDFEQVKPYLPSACDLEYRSKRVVSFF